MNKKQFWIIIAVLILALSISVGMIACDDAKEELESIYKPTNIRYDGTVLTWDEVTLAEYYYVQIDGGERKRTNTNSFVYPDIDKEFEVVVTSVYKEREATQSKRFIPLGDITNLSVDHAGVVSWSAVEGASAYRISLNGEILAQDIQDTSFNAKVGSNRIKIKPIVADNDSYYSYWSEEKQVYVNAAPTSVKFDGSRLSWMGNAGKYEVDINGVKHEVNGNIFEFNPENRDFSVSIKALGNHTSTFDSAVVTDTYHFLDPISDLAVKDGILHWTATSGAEGYQIKINGREMDEKLSSNQYQKLPTGQSLDIQVKPYNESGNYFSSWTPVKTIFILQTPETAWNNSLELDGDARNNLSWNGVNGADGYTVKLTKDGMPMAEVTRSQLFFAEAFLEVGVYTLQVKSNAPKDGSNYYDSKYSDPITVERIAAPKAASNRFIVSDASNVNAGFTVNFVQVSGASGYELRKDGVFINNTTYSSFSVSDVVGRASMTEQNFTYTIRSLGGTKTVSGLLYVTLPSLSSGALSFNITVKATPQNPRMDGFLLKWDQVSESNGYAVAYAGNAISAAQESLDLSTINPGRYDISICAKGNGQEILASSFSTPVVVQRLAAPTNLRITHEAEGTLIADAPMNTKSHRVYIGEEALSIEGENFTNMYQYIETTGTVVSVEAIANEYNADHTVYTMTSPKSPSQTFIRLAAPTFAEGAIASGGTLKWNAPGNVNTNTYTPTYRVYSKENEPLDIGLLNGTMLPLDFLEGGKTYTFLIRAVGNDVKYVDSEYSRVIELYKLKTPSISIENNQYVWHSELGVSEYELTIDGKKVSDEFGVLGTKYAYKPYFEKVGTSTVVLQAKGDGRTSVDSDPLILYQESRKHNTPVIEYYYDKEAVTEGGKIVVKVLNPVDYCTNYLYDIGGASSTVSATEFGKTVQATGKFTIRVKALGGDFDSAGVYYCDSNYAGGSSSDNIVLLSAPSMSDLTLSDAGVLRWKTVADALGYEYQIAYDGGAFGEIVKVSNAPVVLDPTAYRQSITVRIRSCGGNGGRVVTSQWIEKTFG